LQKGNALYGRCLQNAVFGWRSQTPFGAQLCGVCGAPTGVFGASLRVCGALLRVCGAVKLHLTIFPLKKNDQTPYEPIDHLINNAGPADILHLLSDERPVTGLGESVFLQGACWIVPVE